MEHASDSVAKFHGDRPTELGDLAMKQKIIIINSSKT